MSIWQRLATGICIGLAVGLVLGVIAGMLNNRGLDAAAGSIVLFGPIAIGVAVALRGCKRKPNANA